MVCLLIEFHHEVNKFCYDCKTSLILLQSIFKRNPDEFIELSNLVFKSESHVMFRSIEDASNLK